VCQYLASVLPILNTNCHIDVSLSKGRKLAGNKLSGVFQSGPIILSIAKSKRSSNHTLSTLYVCPSEKTTAYFAITSSTTCLLVSIYHFFETSIQLHHHRTVVCSLIFQGPYNCVGSSIYTLTSLLITTLTTDCFVAAIVSTRYD
jgi:hypothetical protein